MCGGTHCGDILNVLRVGLSPRVRGNRLSRRPAGVPARSIPACAGEPQGTDSGSMAWTVYPRVCGGTAIRYCWMAAHAGLSPRVRGNRQSAPLFRGRPRSIPACAGEPGLSSAPPSVIRVYPRVCGGTSPSTASSTSWSGLSPRVRGNRRRLDRDGRRAGSIPACAGEPQCPSCGRRSTSVYPRVCGGTPAFVRTVLTNMGLSPRVRGNRAQLDVEAVLVRSIPACAGEPGDVHPQVVFPKVYPRVCGGTPVLPWPGVVFAGLSPRVRGNPWICWRSPSASRSIPACAGEPKRRPASARLKKVYPRVCGGTRHPGCPGRAFRGLSPRVRGNLEVPTTGVIPERSIPACAGEPRTPALPTKATRVYPRVCGGTATEAGEARAREGLSPRVRGNLLRYQFQIAHARSIPACAGEPPHWEPRAGTAGVYPRVCGGTPPSTSSSPSLTGLSPRVRGNPRQRLGGPAGAGSIPACAGEPLSALGKSGSVCHSKGLSPRVRGNPGTRARRRKKPGSIPACAGEPSSALAGVAASRVYPRVCGGTRNYRRRRHPPGGLSPRVRGNPTIRMWMKRGKRSIPACAGEPLIRIARGDDAGVYPRVCGGTGNSSWRSYNLDGLSPRVRGNPSWRGCCDERSGSIPACAGEPRGRSCVPFLVVVYPRVCGGTVCQAFSTQNPKGLSPRVRGNPARSSPISARSRSIPACAGEPCADAQPNAHQRVYPRVCGGTSRRWSNGICG